jgi:hypothetical protein
MTRKKKTAVARGITATNIGEFVSFHDVYHAHSPVAGNKPPRISCAILGGSSKYGNNSMNSKTRRNRRNQLTTYSFSH